PIPGQPGLPPPGGDVKGTLPVLPAQPVLPPPGCASQAQPCPGPCGPVACCPPVTCCQPVQKICVPEPAVRKINHICFCKVCEDFCVPKCPCCFCFHRCDDCPQCEHVRAKYWLVKKVRVEECPTFKCVPVEVPPCGVPCPPGVCVEPGPVPGRLG